MSQSEYFAAEPKFTEYATAQGVKQVNVVIAELNALRTKVNELLKQLIDKEGILRGKDFNSDREAVRAIAREQVQLASQAGLLQRGAAQKAEQSNKSNLPKYGWLRMY